MSTMTVLAGATERSCPACGGAGRSEVARLQAAQFCKVNETYRDDFASILSIEPDTVFPLVRCTSCAFVYAGLLPSPEFLQAVYDRVIDPDHGFFASCRPFWVSQQLALGSRVLDHLERQFPDQERLTVLDFGCGYGALVRALTGPRVCCRGFETSPRRLAFLEAQGLPASSELKEISALGPYHAVVLSEVLEHVPSPRDTLALCRQLLVADGLLFVHVPDFRDEYLAAALADLPSGRQPRGLNPWEHLNYFSPGSLRRMVGAAGFEVFEPSVVDVGFRPELHGIRRWGNACKSLLRLIRYVLGRRPEETTLVARRGRAEPPAAVR